MQHRVIDACHSGSVPGGLCMPAIAQSIRYVMVTRCEPERCSLPVAPLCREANGIICFELLPGGCCALDPFFFAVSHITGDHERINIADPFACIDAAITG